MGDLLPACGLWQRHDPKRAEPRQSCVWCAKRKIGLKGGRRIIETFLTKTIGLVRNSTKIPNEIVPLSEYCITGAQRHWTFFCQLSVSLYGEKPHTSWSAESPPLPCRNRRPAYPNRYGQGEPGEVPSRTLTSLPSVDGIAKFITRPKRMIMRHKT